MNQSPRISLPVLALAFVTASCCREVGDDHIIPHSLAFSVQRVMVEPGIRGPDLDLTGLPVTGGAVFDSALGADRIWKLWVVPDTSSGTTAIVKGVYQEGIASFAADRQITFTCAAYRDLLRMTAASPGCDLTGDANADPVFLFTYRDSAVVRVFNWSADDPWVVNYAVHLDSGDAVNLLSLWRDGRGSGSRIVLQKKRIPRTPGMPDTLFAVDVATNALLWARPTGGNWESAPDDFIQEAGLLTVWNNVNATALDFGGIDDQHRFIGAYTPDGRMAWSRRLTDSATTGNGGWSVVVDSSRKLLTFVTQRTVRDRDSTLLLLHDIGSGKELRRRTLQYPINSVIDHRGASTGERYVATSQDGTALLLDSAFNMIEDLKLKLPGIIVHPAAYCPVDFNQDGEREILLKTVLGQAVILDGQTLCPLAATAPNDTRSLDGPPVVIRRVGGGVGILLSHGNMLELYDVKPAPTFVDLYVAGAAGALFLVLLWFFGTRVLHERELVGKLTRGGDSHGVVVLDRKGARVRRMSDSVRTILNICGEGTGTRTEQFPRELMAVVERCKSTRASAHSDFVLARNDRESVHLSVCVEMVMVFGRPRSYLITIFDATQHVEQVVTRNQLWLSRAVAHRLTKHPLGTISLDLLGMMAKLRQVAPEAVTAVADYEERLMRNVREAVYELRKVEYMANLAGSFQPDDESLPDIVAEWVSGNRSRYAHWGNDRQPVAIEVDIPEDLPRVYVDNSHFAVLLQCACDNAADAMLDRAGSDMTIRIGARGRNGSVEIGIRDSGRGMDKETLEQALNEIYFTTKRDGSGVGMQIIRRVCAEHNAELDITSTPNEGTTLTIILPTRS